MSVLGQLFSWLTRKAFLYVALVLAIGAATFVLPWVGQQLGDRVELRTRDAALQNAAAIIAEERELAEQQFTSNAAKLQNKSLEALQGQQRELQGEAANLRRQIDGAGPAWQLAVLDRDELLANERRKLRLSIVNQEITAVAAASSVVATRGKSLADRTTLRVQQNRLEKAQVACDAARKARAQYRSTLIGTVDEYLRSPRYQNLQELENSRCQERDRLQKVVNTLQATARRTDAARQRATAAFRSASTATNFIRRSSGELTRDAERAQTELTGSFLEKLRLWSEEYRLAALMEKALFALLAIIAAPYLVRLFSYFVLAPAAMRRRSIRITVPGGPAAAITPAAPSATSVAVKLLPGEELLVRQDYLQTTSHAGAKATQWFLDWRKPVTSMAAGLTFLTRIRGDGEATTVSAVRDGLAEVTILALPQGGACVLQPRALAAVAQPIGRPLLVTSHWRLGSLNAWLTLQLRYLVFHGPVRLVLRGGRGVRVEPASQGRIFGQDQLVGFSADLAYSVTRTETFWPYFFGREQLLKERVLDGGGVVILEEAPLTARHGEVRQGLEGMIDAGMKVFGV